MANQKGQAIYSYLGYAIIGVVILGALYLFMWSDVIQQAQDPGLAEARQAVAKRQWGTALSLFSKAVELKPDNAQAYAGRARAYTELGNLGQAFDDINHAIKLQHRNSGFIGQKGVILKMQGKLEEADRTLASAIRINKKDGWAVGQRADVLMRKSKPEEALQEANNAIKLEPRLVGNYCIRAWILTNMGRCKDAAEDFKKVEVMGGSDAWFLQSKAWFLLTCQDETVRDPDKAMQLAEKAVELSGGRNGIVLETLAEANFRKGDPLKAADLQKKAIELEKRKCPDGSCVDDMKDRLKKYEMASRQEIRPRQEMLPLGPPR